MFVSAAALVAVSLASAESDAQTRTGIDHTEAHGEAAGQPIRLAYLCGNRFLVTSTLRSPVTLRFRVDGTDQEGTIGLQGLPQDDPEVSEAVLETRRPGRVELMLGGRRVAASDNGRVPCVRSTPVPTEPDVSAAAPADDGAWTAPFNWPVVAVHLHLLPNGQVLSWGLQDTPRIWNPASNAFTAVPSPDLLFCAGHAFLADGRLLVAGGHIADRLGLPDVNLFATAGGWQSAAPMAQGRWYPSATTMPNGQVVILAGSDEDGTNVLVPEVWNGGGITALPGASRSFPYYPRVFLAPNGRLFYAGSQATTRYLNITGAGGWTTVANRRVANREYGSAAMYAPGRILYAGGGRTTNSAEIIDLNQATPTWTLTDPMAFARRHLNLTILPTGEVLATGGVAGTTFNDLSRPVRAAEIWNPDTGEWRTLASSAITRGYHATSILLPDGRVLHTGSGDYPGAPRRLNAELFSPPYLFAGPRPTIGSVPGTVGYNNTFRVGTPQAATIAKVSLIRLGSTTHAFDQNQRFVPLSFTADATGLTVRAPTQRTAAPPGHYMLFIVNDAGVPSVARIVRLP